MPMRAEKGENGLNDREDAHENRHLHPFSDETVSVKASESNTLVEGVD